MKQRGKKEKRNFKKNEESSETSSTKLNSPAFKSQADQKKKTVNFQYTFYGKEYDFTADILKLNRNEFLIEFTDEKGNHWKLQMFSRSNY